MSADPEKSVKDEKTPKYYAGEAVRSGSIATGIIDHEVAASDGDDALRLVGTHAHQFDEQYYKKLARKIVRIEYQSWCLLAY